MDLSSSGYCLDISSSEHRNITLCSLRVDKCVTNWLKVTTVPCGDSYEQEKSKITGRWRKDLFALMLGAKISSISCTGDTEK